MKNFTHEQIESIVQWMNSWDQLRGTEIPSRFKEIFSKQKCEDCCYKETGQSHPRLCIECGHPEESAIDYESLKILDTPITSTNQLVEVFKWLRERDLALQRIKGFPGMQSEPAVDFIKVVNEKIKQILNL